MEITQNEINENKQDKKSNFKTCKTCHMTKDKTKDFYIKNLNASCKVCIREKNKIAYRIYYKTNKREHRQEGIKRLFDQNIHIKDLKRDEREKNIN